MGSENIVAFGHFVILCDKKKNTDTELRCCLKFAIKFLILYKVSVVEKKC